MFHFLQALLVALAVAIDAATVAACEGISRGCKHSWSTLATIALLLEYCKAGLRQLAIAWGQRRLTLLMNTIIG